MKHYYRTAGHLAQLAEECGKKDLEPEDLVLEVCRRHQIDDLGLLTDFGTGTIAIEWKRFSIGEEVIRQFMEAQVHVDLANRNSIRVCGKIEGDRLVKAVALNLAFAEEAFMLVKCC